MSEVLFSLQFKFAQCHTWVMKKVVKHNKLLNIYCIVYIIHVVTNTHYFPELFNSYDPRLILELCLCSISCEIIGGFDQIW